ncbi:MAG: hypothetical protein IPI38_09485 [Gemmatimonadetes bacterium]|jgi:hypothetical protein|nr:hypothetical protein [Gemmatimonadota bacterium]MBP6669866.1 hypothetical protein [Gemmatimonadales bacterium]MBK6781597.1 hypothetical protein [Gemmatimonadota bacterium]MBK7350025.1 hypothetical protein [Gemmatimonadota bacterium]MBK7715641.1 hypothetical protein [Gemmatimonadota bacterium]
MTAPTATEPLPGRPVPRVAMAASALALGALAVWMLLGLYQTRGARECLARYGAARTAADTARVDALVPGPAGPEAHSCGFTRRTARW